LAILIQNVSRKSGPVKISCHIASPCGDMIANYHCKSYHLKNKVNKLFEQLPLDDQDCGAWKQGFHIKYDKIIQKMLILSQNNVDFNQG
jgi:hypothetical protein